MPSCGRSSISGEVERLGLGQQALMHGVRPEAGVDQARPHDFRGHGKGDLVVGQPPGGVFG